MTAINQNKNIKTIPNELIDFNWAACLLTFVWGIKYKAWITFLAIPLFFIQLPLGLNWVLLFAFQIYCGFKGNEWAYKQEWWKKSKDFRISQMKWASFALTTYILLPLILLTLTSNFLKNTDNLPELIKNTQCIMAKKYVQHDLNNIAKDGITTSITNDSKNRNKLSKTHTITVNKQDDRPCTLSNQNCLIIYNFYFKENYSDIPNECVFYFSDTKEVLPHSNTKQSINKGINIFKYLK